MEDFVSIIWIVLIGAAALFSAAKSSGTKRKKAKQAARSTESAPTQFQQIPPPLPVNSTENNVSVAYSGSLTNSFAQEPETTPDVPSSEITAEPDEEFDLRKAVIYSEILKPGFDE